MENLSKKFYPSLPFLISHLVLQPTTVCHQSRKPSKQLLLSLPLTSLTLNLMAFLFFALPWYLNVQHVVFSFFFKCSPRHLYRGHSLSILSYSFFISFVNWMLCFSYGFILALSLHPYIHSFSPSPSFALFFSFWMRHIQYTLPFFLLLIKLFLNCLTSSLSSPHV